MAHHIAVNTDRVLGGVGQGPAAAVAAVEGEALNDERGRDTKTGGRLTKRKGSENEHRKQFN